MFFSTCIIKTYSNDKDDIHESSLVNLIEKFLHFSFYIQNTI